MTQQREIVLREKHCFFDSEGYRLLGVVHKPPPDAAVRPMALVFLHGWAGYRIGPHQMFTKLARNAAERGFYCLRFDFRGRGDSEGDTQATTITTMIEDACHAADFILEESGLKRVALIGDCSGSEVALGAGPLHQAVSEMVLWSAPIVAGDRDSADRAKQRRIIGEYVRKVFRAETWRKLFKGRLRTGQIVRVITGGGKGAGEEGDESDLDIDWLERFTAFTGERMFIYGGNDPTTSASLEHYKSLCREIGQNWNHHVVKGANHAFYSLAWENEVMDVSLKWLEERAGIQAAADCAQEGVCPQ